MIIIMIIIMSRKRVEGENRIKKGKIRKKQVSGWL